MAREIWWIVLVVVAGFLLVLAAALLIVNEGSSGEEADEEAVQRVGEGGPVDSDNSTEAIGGHRAAALEVGG